MTPGPPPALLPHVPASRPTRRFVILLGGELSPSSRLGAQLAGASAIAADSGMAHAAALGLEPILWMGDFDSSDDALIRAHPDIPRATFPADKNMTDGELAVAEAVKRGADEIVLAGAFGGPRADHAFLHLTLALRLAEGGTSTLLTSGTQEGRPLLPGSWAEFDYSPGTVFSVLGFSELSALSIEGVRWPLDRVVVPFGSSLTLSNRVATRLRIRLERGKALLLAHPL